VNSIHARAFRYENYLTFNSARTNSITNAQFANGRNAEERQSSCGT